MKKICSFLLALVLVLAFSLVPALPVLAAPVVASVTGTEFGTNTTAHNVSMPEWVNAGDLLIVLFTNRQDTTVTTPGNWTQLASNASGIGTDHVRVSVYYKIAEGTEGNTTVNFATTVSVQAAAQVYGIINWHGTTPPEISTAITGNSTAPDPSSLNPDAWGVEDTLWIAVAGQARGDESGNVSYPANYTNGISTQSGTEVGLCTTHSARRVRIACSEDPGTFTITGTNPWVAFTIAVRPAVYNLIMAVSPVGSGSATDETATSPYAAGTVVNITAAAAPGYQFVEWTAPAGTFGDASDAETTFTMPGQHVTVTAHFEEVPEVSTVTTKAATTVGINSATLNMDYTVGDYSSVHVRFTYKKYGATAWSYTLWESKSVGGTYNEVVTGLASQTEYDFKAQLKYNDTVIEGTTRQFTTAEPLISCFIATAAYGTPAAEQIDVLREFRDAVLLESTAGSQFVALYYRLSPPIAEFIAGNELSRTLVRELLVDPVVWVVEATGDIWRN